MNPSNTIDCRGQRCPAPILATAKAARSLGATGGGLLEIAADDDAFPLDIRSWCRSSGSELVDLQSNVDGVHTAVVRVNGRSTNRTARAAAGVPASKPVAAVAEPVAPSSSGSMPTMEPLEPLDFRGQRCPAPILGLARKARTLGPGTELEVVADDPAFRLDLESWCRSAGATVVSLDPEGDSLRARIRLGGTSSSASSSSNTLDRTSVEPGSPPRISLRGVPSAERLSRLQAEVASRGGQRVRILADDPGFSGELVQWITTAGHRLLSLDARQGLEAEVELGGAPSSSAALVPAQPQAVAQMVDNQCTLLVLHNDREALLAALLVGVGAAAQGMNVMMFFTFWGLNLLRGDEPNTTMPREKVSWAQRMFKWMMPRGPKRQRLGQLNFGGIGKGMLGSIMKRYELMDIPELMSTAEEQGVSFVACTMSMQVMGITKRDLAPRGNLEYGGVAAFVEAAARSRMSLTF